MTVALDKRSTTSPPGPPRVDVRQMFDRIAGRYDAANHIMSCCVDRGWRRRICRRLKQHKCDLLVDIASGTGDQLQHLHNCLPHLKQSIALDFSLSMLQEGSRRFTNLPCMQIAADAGNLPLAEKSADAITISFGIRNFPDTLTALRETHRVLKPGGLLLILEFGMPAKPLRWPYHFYLHHIMPHIGGLLSGDTAAYDYLHRTIETFPYGNDFARLLELAGFMNIKSTPLSHGIAYLYEGTKEG